MLKDNLLISGLLPLLLFWQMGLAAPPASGDQAIAEMHVTLPAMVISEFRDGLPWQYARFEDFEVLTLANRQLTAAVLKAELRGRDLLPVEFQGKRSRPIPMILYDHESPGTAPGTSTLTSAARQLGKGWQQRTGSFAQKDDDSILYAANLQDVNQWATLGITYAWQLLEDSRPTPVDWLTEALFGDDGAISSLAGTNEGEARVRLGTFAWDKTDRAKQLMEQTPLAGGFPPLAELFERAPPVASGDRERWQLQAALFARWQLYGNDGFKQRDRSAFWRFALRANAGAPLTETVFKECFGLSYAEAGARMKKYLPIAMDDPVDIPIRPYPSMDYLELRPATEAEVARLKGNFERLEAKRLRPDHPALAAEYEAAARRTLQRGLKLAGDDPQVRAVLGMLELETGHPGEARSHLEAALAANVAGPRLQLTVAHLRLAEARSQPGGAGGLTPAQLESVLTPLYAARQQTPVVDETYERIGEAWGLSAQPPQPGHLAVLLEGISYFPRNLDLIRQAAELHARFGFKSQARALAQLGTQRAGSSEQRARFDQLLTSLGAPPAIPAPP